MKIPTVKKLFAPVSVAGLMLTTLLLRLVGVTRLYDLHIDEVTYGHFAASINDGHLPLLYDGQPFFLHPPGYYYLLALWR